MRIIIQYLNVFFSTTDVRIFNSQMSKAGENGEITSLIKIEAGSSVTIEDLEVKMNYNLQTECESSPVLERVAYQNYFEYCRTNLTNA